MNFTVYEVSADRAMTPPPEAQKSIFRYAIMEQEPDAEAGHGLTRTIAWCCNKGEAHWVADMLNGPGIARTEQAIELLKNECKNLDIDEEGHERPPKACGCALCRIRKLLGGEL